MRDATDATGAIDADLDIDEAADDSGYAHPDQAELPHRARAAPPRLRRRAGRMVEQRQRRIRRRFTRHLSSRARLGVTGISSRYGVGPELGPQREQRVAGSWI
jgi:hypothetical protein